METGRGRRSVLPEEVALVVNEEVLRITSELWDGDDCPRPRFVNAGNPDLKKSE